MAEGNSPERGQLSTTNFDNSQPWNAEGQTHEQLVQAFRNFVEARSKMFDPSDSYEEVIHKKLALEARRAPSSNEELNKEQGKFF